MVRKESAMSKWMERYRAYKEHLSYAWLSPSEGHEQNGPDESIELGEVVPHMEPPSVESLEQLSEWCGIVHSADLLPYHLRQIQDSAENLGVRVKLPVLPMEAEFLDGRNQELMDRWKNIVTEFIESIKRSLEKLCTDDPILDNEVKKGVDTTDTKTDRKNKFHKKRRITQEAVKCGEYVRHALLLDPTKTRKMAVQEYVDENGGSAVSLDRRLGDNKQLYEPK
jgi:hypothetical protein